MRRRLWISLILAAAVAGLEFWGGAVSHSLALTTDAVHVCMDVFALAVALLAAIGAMRPANRRKTFGYGRLEVLGALLNGAVLLGATGVIVYEAVRRFSAPVEPHGLMMTEIAAIGLVVNVTIGLTLARHGHDHDLNVRAVMFHVLGDALGALAVIFGGILIQFTHQAWIDPLLSLFVAAIIVVGVVRVLRDATDVLLESTPRGIETRTVERDLRTIPGVVAVHDLHIWSIGSASSALSTHLLLDDQRLSEAGSVLREARERLATRYGINHVTVQFEAEHCDPDSGFICIHTD
jgi:cobalt-zinc-cadmium efflux system protein